MSEHGAERPLAGIGVLVTRPEGQGEGLCAAIRAAGGAAFSFPVIAIRDPADPARLESLVDRLDSYDLAIFVSPNAVERALPRIRARWSGWPAGPRVAVVGRGSARALERHGVAVDFCPEGRADSEGLLALPGLGEMAGRRVVIFRGQGGREVLAEALRGRGAVVDYAESYRRALPEADAAPLLARWRGGAIQAAVVTSNAGLENLHALVGAAGRALLLDTVLVVVSGRAAERARQLGFRHPPRVARGADDGALLEALIAWRTVEKTQRQGARTPRRQGEQE
ncbi:MAG: uroporphyrinogen-III synthase [Gammaproteobacteria bacterium]|nr:uroporphyrinogen-III synthase [Gammaproteobacteria bacterium]